MAGAVAGDVGPPSPNAINPSNPLVRMWSILRRSPSSEVVVVVVAEAGAVAEEEFQQQPELQRL